MDIEQLIDTYGDYLYRIAFIYTRDPTAAEAKKSDEAFCEITTKKESELDVSTGYTTITYRKMDNSSSNIATSYMVFTIFHTQSKSIAICLHREHTYTKKELRKTTVKMELHCPACEKNYITQKNHVNYRELVHSQILPSYSSSLRNPRNSCGKQKGRPKFYLESPIYYFRIIVLSYRRR